MSLHTGTVSISYTLLPRGESVEKGPLEGQVSSRSGHVDAVGTDNGRKVGKFSPEVGKKIKPGVRHHFQKVALGRSVIRKRGSEMRETKTTRPFSSRKTSAMY